MKIRTRLALRYSIVSAAVITLFAAGVYIFSDYSREKEFHRTLVNEGITKAHLFLDGLADAGVMQSIYYNNREFIDEVQVAVYDGAFNLIYHDAADIDIVKETPQMLRQIADRGEDGFQQGEFQVAGLLMEHGGKSYIVTAAAFDGYGHSNMAALGRLLLLFWLAGIVIVSVFGYFMAAAALSPVSGMVDAVSGMKGHGSGKRLRTPHPDDELGVLAATLNGLLDRLEEAYDAQKMFVSNVAHEVRTPLASLIAELELAGIRKETTIEQLQEAVSLSLDDARRLERLCAGLLDFARAGYDSSSIRMEEVRLDELLLDARRLIGGSGKGHKVELLFGQESDDDSLITVVGNEYLLRTAFINIMENNCKFSPDSTCHVHISYYGDYSIIRLSDNGPGIAKEDLDRIFHPFVRLASAGQTAGYGIGLALVKKVVTLHKGEISVNSHLGEGTVFTVRLPHI